MKHQRFVEMVAMAVVAFGLSACGGGSSGGGSSGGGSSGGGPLPTNNTPSPPAAPPAQPHVVENPPAATGPSLMALVTGDQKLDLLDPTKAVSGSNPVSVDTEMPTDTFSSVFPFVTGTFESGATSGNQTVRLAYVKNGTVFTVDMVASADHTPVQVSDLTNVCDVMKSFSPVSGDASDGWLWVRVPQTAGGPCDQTAQGYMVSMSTPAGSAPVSMPAGVTHVYSTVDPQTGLISGFMDSILNDDTSTTHQLRDANFANPKDLGTTATGSEDQIDQAGATQIYFIYVPTGGSVDQLFSLNTVTGVMSGPLYTFQSTYTVSGTPPTLSYAGAGGHGDATNYYFIDANDLLQIPRSATTSGQATVIGTLTTSGIPIPDGIYPTKSRVVVAFSEQGQMAETIVSAPIGGNGGLATTLTQNGNLPSVDSAAGKVFFNAASGGAEVIQDDGSDATSLGAGTQWVGGFSGNWANVQTTLDPSLAGMVLGTTAGTNETLTAYDSATAAAINALGQVPAGTQTYASGVRSRYLGIEAAVGAGSLSAYVADTQTPNSVALVSDATGQGSNQFVGY